MEQLYRDFTVCKKCGGRCYLGNEYCEDCVNKMWQKLKKFAKETYEYFDQYENMEDCASGYKYTLEEMQELEKETMKSE